MISFPRLARRKDPEGHMVVQEDLGLVRDAVNSHIAGTDSGSAIVPNGSSVLTVNHGLGTASFTAKLTPVGDPVNRYWVANKTSTQFDINLSAVAGASGVPFDWEVTA